MSNEDIEEHKQVLHLYLDDVVDFLTDNPHREELVKVAIARLEKWSDQES